MYLVCMYVCCFCYMYSRFEKLCRACVLCMLWYASTLNKTLFIIFISFVLYWHSLSILKCRSMYEAGNFIMAHQYILLKVALNIINLNLRMIILQKKKRKVHSNWVKKKKSSKFEITLFYVKNGNSYQGYGLMSDIVAYINTENLSSF